jgi:hypothetical protein
MMWCFSHGTSLDTERGRKFHLHFFGPAAQEQLGPEKSSLELRKDQTELTGGGLGRPVILAGLRPGQNYNPNSAWCELSTFPSLVRVQE